MAFRKVHDQAEESRGSGTSSEEHEQRQQAEDHGSQDNPKVAKRPSFLKRIVAALELDVFTVLLMLKGGAPPALALALLQVNVIANHFTTIGYLVAIIATIGMAILPRAKFIQNLITSLVLVCIAAAMALLVGYCVTQARAHTSVITPQTARAYNSSASVVAAVWLFFQVYVANAARAKYPQLQLPVIIYSIFSVVTCINMPQFPTMTTVIAFVEKLLEAFLTGLACATAISLLVLPVAVRQVVLKQMAGYIGLLQKCLKTHQAYLHSLEDPIKLKQVMVYERNKDYVPTAESQAVHGAVTALTGLHGKLQGDLPLAKREIAYGKFNASHLGMIMKHLRRVMLPTIGITAMNDLIERLASFHGWSQRHLNEGLTDEETATREAVTKEWTDNLKAIRGSFDTMITTSCEGLEHAALQLQLKKLPKGPGQQKSDDVEAKAQSVRPGEPGFTAHLEEIVDKYHSGKREMLRNWCQRHGINISPGFFDKPQPEDVQFMEEAANAARAGTTVHQTNQRQIYMLLYLDFLMWSCAKAILNLARYSDQLVADGTMSKSRLIVPGWRRMVKWLRTFLNAEEGPNEEPRGDLGDLDQAAAMVYLGSAFNEKKDPEHLPARNVFEKCGNAIRWVPRMLRSQPSLFGFRVAVATMSIAIIAYLRDTQTWFVVHRILWAIIMVAISMTPTAGQSVFSFVLRILGTVAAMVAAFVCYYIVDKHRAGVIVFTWIYTSMGMWLLLKKPQLAIVGILSVVTNVLIIGYTLEVEKVGRQVATSNGQEYLPIYKLGPYRLATVCGGLLVAFIFTILPYPITDHSQLRQNTGGALYLLANYYSIVHESIKARTRNLEGDLSDKKSLGARLTKLRLKVFTKQMLMLTNLRTHSSFQRFEIPVGGRFPKAQYDVLIQSISSLTRYVALLAYSSESLTADDHHLTQWSQDLKTLLDSVGHTSHEITSMLSLLSAAMANGQPLPPYMNPPQPFYFSKKLEALDPDILSIRHIDEPEYAIFAVFQVASRCIIFELDTLLRTVKELVGELDFSFHVVQTANSSRTLVADKSSDSQKRKGD